MAHEYIELGGGRQASVGNDFKQKIQKLVRKHSPDASSGKSFQEIEQELCKHSYLAWDEWGSAMHQAAAKRYHHCLQVLNELSPRLDKLSIVGIDGTTGQAALTADKLRGRPISLLEVAPNWLLVEVPRHPTGGSGRLKIQYWLYERGASTIELLRPVENVVKVPFNNPLRQDATGVWKSASEERDSFLQLVEALLGPAARHEVEKLTDFQLILLSTPGNAILDECEKRTGHPYRIEKAKQAKIAADRYTKKFGPRTRNPGGVSINATRGATLHTLEANHFLKQLAGEISDYLATNYSSLGCRKASDVTVELKTKESPACFEIHLHNCQFPLRISMKGYAMEICDFINAPESATLDVKRRGTLDEFDLAVIVPDGHECDVQMFVSWLMPKFRCTE